MLNKCNLIKMKSFCTTKETISKVKRQPSEWEKIIANEATDKELISTIYTSKFGKLSSGHRTGKGQFSFQSQRKAMPKNAQTTAQLHSSHTLVE